MFLSRRSVLHSAFGAIAAPLITRGRYRLFAGIQTEYSGRAIELVQRSSVIDMLGLLTVDYRRLCAWQNDSEPFSAQEFHRFLRSGVTVIHPAVGFVKGDVHRLSRDDLDRWNCFLAANPDLFLRVDCAADVDRAKRSGRLGVILGLQNSAHFRTVEDVDSFYALGQRVSQLTYYDNALGGGSTTPSRGLSLFGARVVERMNRVGMAIDVSHCSDQTTIDAIDASTKPVLITHSNCRTLVPNSARCKTDDAIRKSAAKGGVFGVTMVRYFVRSGGPATIEHLLDHIEHIVSVGGAEHVGLGTDVDLDGRDNGGGRRQDLDGLRYSQKILEVAEGLIRRKFIDADIELCLGGNFRRVLAEIWTVPANPAQAAFVR